MLRLMKERHHLFVVLRNIVIMATLMFREKETENVCFILQFVSSSFESWRHQPKTIWIELVCSKRWNMSPSKIHTKKQRNVSLSRISCMSMWHGDLFFFYDEKLISMKHRIRINKWWANLPKNDRRDRWPDISIMNLKSCQDRILIRYHYDGKRVLKKRRRILLTNHLSACIELEIRT